MNLLRKKSYHEVIQSCNLDNTNIFSLNNFRHIQNTIGNNNFFKTLKMFTEILFTIHYKPTIN